MDFPDCLLREELVPSLPKESRASLGRVNRDYLLLRPERLTAGDQCGAIAQTKAKT
jgi:hypothetical protein